MDGFDSTVLVVDVGAQRVFRMVAELRANFRRKSPGKVAFKSPMMHDTVFRELCIVPSEMSTNFSLAAKSRRGRRASIPG